MPERVFDPAGVFFGVAVPVAAALSGFVATWLWSSRLPDRLVTHWGPGGADGYATPMTSASLFAIGMLLVGGGSSAIAALAQALLLMRRAMLTIGYTVLGLLVVLQFSVLIGQLDGAVPTDAPSGAMTIGTGIGFVAGAAAATTLRDYRERAPAPCPPAAGLPRGPREPVALTVGLSNVEFLVVLAVVAGAMTGVCLAADGIWPVTIAAPILLIVLGLLRFRVVVDESGVRVSNVGLMTVDIGIAEVTGAKATEVNPFRDFGGWGLRSKGHRRYGIVTETGQAVVISAASGLTLTITTDRAEAIAGALNSWADHRGKS